MNEELATIKKIYGEEMMHLCRELFPGILENEGRLIFILKNNLAPTHSFAKNIIDKNLYTEFKDWIYSFINVETNNLIITDRTPFELMDEAGYILYECKTEEDIQSFKKYYAPHEVLCTIYNGGRLSRCYVFFAVKKNVDEIRRENFPNPKRQDEYGTSVISIQFSIGEINDLSIKNRYNHAVNKPDATFSNNLDNIIPGLTNSFEKFYGLNINQNTKKEASFLTDKLKFVKANDDRYYKYNIEVNSVYYCENNIIIKDGNVITKYANNRERYIFIDQYIIDLKEKTISYYDDKITDAFIESIYNIGKIKNIEIKKNGNNKIITFNYNDNKQVNIEINKINAIIGYENNYIAEIGNSFLRFNKQLSSISLPQVQTIGNFFLKDNEQLSSISLPQVQMIGYDFCFNNEQLSSISLPQVQMIGDTFCFHNKQLISILLPNVQAIGSYFLYGNKQLNSIFLPLVEIIGDNSLSLNEQLSSISLPQVHIIGNNFLSHNEILSSISLPFVHSIGEYFLRYNHYINKERLFEEIEERRNGDIISKIYSLKKSK